MRTLNNSHNSQPAAMIHLFQNCSEPAIESLFQAGETRIFPKGQNIYEQGQTPENIYFLLKGIIKIYKVGTTGQVMIKDIIYPEKFFGEIALFEAAPIEESAQSIAPDTEVLTISISKFKQLITKFPEINTILLNEIGKKLVTKEEKLASFHFNDAKSRIINFIRETGQNIGIRVGLETLIKHSFTQQDIANITGTSRQTVTFVMNSLKKNNIIHFDRNRILIRDLAQL